ncbi:ribosome maturation factor RimP [Sanguibacter sp. A247]|uniref:ribosome maturation factor RimP n=1 Tax=unclassified Sanguibacter TaxID=2645534 RepID=UPI003FD80AEA
MASQHEDLAAAVTAAIAGAVGAADLFLEDVTISGPVTRSVVRVTVDLGEDEVGSLPLERLADVSRAVSEALDASDVLPHAYQLEVSSPGATRTLTDARHFRRARTRLVRVEMRDGTEILGRLTDVEGDALVLDGEAGVTHRPLLADVRRGRVELEMRRIDEVDLGDDDVED